MMRWPWITALIAAILALNPVGLDFFHSAFLAGEQLTRNIARPLYLTAATILAALALFEWGIRIMIARRRMRLAKGTET